MSEWGLKELENKRKPKLKKEKRNWYFSTSGKNKYWKTDLESKIEVMRP